MTYSIEAIRAHAAANYNKDGWDFLVECWSDKDIAEAAGKARSDKAAIANVKAALAPLAERRDEVRAEIDCEAEAPEINWVGEALPSAAHAAIEGKAQIEEGKAKGAAALAIMVAGFASDEVATFPWSFDVTVNGDVHHHVECTGIAEFGGTEGAWRYNGEGKVSRDAQSAFRAGLQASFFGLEKNNNAVWTMTSKAVPMALAIRAEGMTAKIVEGKLALEGGTGEKAEAMRAAAAKSLSALTKVAKDETGTSREGHGNAKGEGTSEARLATPAEVLALAARLVEGAAKGDEALSGTALSFARKIAAIVAANPDAFADD